MKKQRRIEITVFRRRTTIVSRDRSEVGSLGRPNGDSEASHPVHANSACGVEVDRDQAQTNLPTPPGSSSLIKDTNDPKSS